MIKEFYLLGMKALQIEDIHSMLTIKIIFMASNVKSLFYWPCCHKSIVTSSFPSSPSAGAAAAGVVSPPSLPATSPPDKNIFLIHANCIQSLVFHSLETLQL